LSGHNAVVLKNEILEQQVYSGIRQVLKSICCGTYQSLDLEPKRKLIDNSELGRHTAAPRGDAIFSQSALAVSTTSLAVRTLAGLLTYLSHTNFGHSEIERLVDTVFIGDLLKLMFRRLGFTVV
jgi:hypothetical protein